MEGTQLGLTHPCTSSSTFAFYCITLGWKDWGPRMNTRILLLCQIHGGAGCWPWQMCWLSLSPIPAGAQAVSFLTSLLSGCSNFEFLSLSCFLNHFAYSHFILQHLSESSPNSFHPFFHVSTFLSALCFCVSFLSSFLVIQQFPESLSFTLFLVIQQFFLVAFPVFPFSVPLTFAGMPPCWYKTFCHSELSITLHPHLLKSFLLPPAAQWLSFPNTVSSILHLVSSLHSQPEMCDHSSTLQTTGMPWASLQWLPKSLAAQG